MQSSSAPPSWIIDCAADRSDPYLFLLLLSFSGHPSWYGEAGSRTRMPPGCETAAAADDANCEFSNNNNKNTTGGAPQLPPWPAHGPSLSDPWHLLWPLPRPQTPIRLWWHLHQLSQHRLLPQLALLESRRRGVGGGRGGRCAKEEAARENPHPAPPSACGGGGGRGVNPFLPVSLEKKK